MVIIFILLVFTAGPILPVRRAVRTRQGVEGIAAAGQPAQRPARPERSANEDLRASTTNLSAQVKSATSERDALSSQIADLTAKAQQQAARASQATSQLSDANAQLGALRDRAEKAEKALTAEQQVSAAARAQVEALTASVAALRQQLAQIAAALDVSEAKVKDQGTQIADLGKRLNLALATKVQELARFRSEFFGRLREIIGDRPDIRIVGDRFVFQSEVLFTQGSADLDDAAKKQLDPVITALEGYRGEDPGRI